MLSWQVDAKHFSSQRLAHRTRAHGVSVPTFRQIFAVSDATRRDAIQRVRILANPSPSHLDEKRKGPAPWTNYQVQERPNGEEITVAQWDGDVYNTDRWGRPTTLIA